MFTGSRVVTGELKPDLHRFCMTEFDRYPRLPARRKHLREAAIAPPPPPTMHYMNSYEFRASENQENCSAYL